MRSPWGTLSADRTTAAAPQFSSLIGGRNSRLPAQLSSVAPRIYCPDDSTHPHRFHLRLPSRNPSQADPEKGLTEEEVTVLREQFGLNELPEKKVNPFLVFLSYLWGPMPIMIWAAIIIELAKSIAVGEGWEDFAVLMVLQFANATGERGWGRLLYIRECSQGMYLSPARLLPDPPQSASWRRARPATPSLR